MAIVQAGKPFTAEDLQAHAGDLAASIRNGIQQGGNFKVQLESWVDADLVALGLTPEEVNAIKGFFVGDLPALQTALGNSVWIKQLLGLG